MKTFTFFYAGIDFPLVRLAPDSHPILFPTSRPFHHIRQVIFVHRAMSNTEYTYNCTIHVEKPLNYKY